MIPTYQGPVGLRRPRDQQKITLHRGWYHKSNLQHPIVISKGWLKSHTEGGKTVKAPEVKDAKEIYRLHVKQAMLIASTAVEIQDLQGPNAIDQMTGAPFLPERQVQASQEAEDRQRAWISGSLPVPLLPGSESRRLSARPDTKEERHKLRRNNLLIKMGRKTYQTKERCFRIDNGKLKVYKIHRRVGDKPKTYDLADVPYQLERSDFLGLAEPFHSKDYTNRIRLNLRERPQGPVYLYTQDAKEAKSWERAVRMSKYLGKASDREALRYVVGRVAGSVCSKAWGALFQYAKEITTIKEQVKNLAMRLMREDLSRGWTKARLVYQQRMQKEAKREEQLAFVNNIMKERMAAINNQALRPPALIRQETITKVQKAFRHFRMERIMARNYFLGNGGHASTRAQQALTGVRMDSAFESLTTEEVLKLVFEGASAECLAKLENEPEILETKSPNYSMVVVPLRSSTLTLSEKFSMLAFAEVDEHSELSHLAKGSWAHFVNVNQISSIVLNTPRVLRQNGKQKDILPGHCGGVWFTINGPRVCWGRKPGERSGRKLEVKGAADGYRLSKDLAQGFKVRWFKVSIIIEKTTLPRAPLATPKVCGAKEEDPQNPDVDLGGIDDEDVLEGGREGKRFTYMVMHLLGRRFESDLYEGDEPTYCKTPTGITKIEAVVPVPEDLAEIGFLDHQEISADIMEWYGEDKAAVAGTRKRERGKSRCIWTGKLPLNELFATEKDERDEGHDAHQGGTASLTTTVGTGAISQMTGPKSIRLVEPNASGHTDYGLITVTATASFEDGRRSLPPISPELQGTGPLTSLYSSHRGAWYDPVAGDAKFLTGQAPSFVEVVLDELRFPESDEPDPGQVYEYTVEASCMGVTVSSIPIHRAKPVWGQVISVNPSALNFEENKVFVPLPPGAWCAEERRPRIELCVRRTLPLDVPAMSFPEFQRGHTPRVFEHPEREPMYRAYLGLDGMLIDEPRRGVRVMMWTPGMRPPEVMISSPEAGGAGPAGVMASSAELVFSATLRDREYVRMHSVKEMGQDTVLCVGEKAIMKVEEPLTYPQTEMEFRRRCFPDQFDPAKTRNHALAGHWGPLRDPSSMTEYQESGLDKLRPAPQPKTRYIPPSSEDLIPHKFVLPSTEVQFRRQSRPGVWWRIVERLVRDSVQGKQASPHSQGVEHPPIVVKELSHLIKHVPVTVLAVYSNRTCDVEIDPSFPAFWEKHPEKHFCLPGNLYVRRFEDMNFALRTAPVSTGDVGSRLRVRALLKGVPVSSVTGVQAASFNIYDTNFVHSEDVIKEHPCSVCNDFNPRHVNSMDDVDYSRKGGYFVRAGPLPPDAGAICQYEWSLNLHAKSEEMMYQFITNLRQCARLDLEEQLKKLHEYKQRQGMLPSTAPYNLGVHTLSQESGHLEVVLVEAHHLQPSQVQPDKDLPSALKRMSLPAMNAAATFVLRDETRDKASDLVYRGSKVQKSSIVPGINPSWAQVDELKSSGGWVFKSPEFDPGSMPGLGFELHLWNGAKSAGLVRVPVTGGRHIVEFERDGHLITATVVDTRPASEETVRGTEHLLRYWNSHLYLDRHEEWVMIEGGKVYFGHGQNRIGLPYVVRWYQASPGVPEDMDLCNVQDRWKNLWLPLSDLDPADPTGKQIKESISGEVHILVLWVPSRQTDKRFKYEPKTARAWRAHSIRPKLQLPEASLRDPTTELQCRKKGYNPNLWREEWPKSRAEAFADYVELIEDSQPYLLCCGRQSEGLWRPLYDELKALGHQGKSLGDVRREAVGTDVLYKLNELLRRGVPPSFRRHIWMEILGADKIKEEFTGSRQKGDESVKAYRKLLEAGAKCRSDAMVQLQEDIVGAAGWETCMNPGAMTRHLQLLSKAQDVCVALIAFSSHHHKDCINFTRPAKPGNSYHRPALYSETLLVLAFFLLIAQEPDYEDPGHPVDRLDVQRPSEAPPPEADADRAFWMLYALLDNDAYSPYFAVPQVYQTRPTQTPGIAKVDPMRDEAPMSSSLGAMEDVWHLRLCVARYEKDLWVHLEAIGFQLPSIFYGAFLRLFAFSLPPPSVFRLWDAIFADIKDPTVPGATPEATREASRMKPPRRLLICLAFGILRRCREELLRCESALEVNDCIVHYMESMYDPSAVVDLAAEMELFLWDPLQREFKVPPLHTRDFELNEPFWDQHFYQFRMQNLVLREMIQTTQIDARILDQMTSGSSSVAVENRVTTRNLVNLIIPTVQKTVMPAGYGSVGGMFRPTPRKLRSIAPETDKDLKGTISSWASWAYERATQAAKSPEPLPPPSFLPRPPGALGEPDGWDIAHLQASAGRSLGGQWAMSLQRLYQTFQNPWDHKASVCEMFAALICASKGTAGEKAMALFYLYASSQPLHRVNHITPVTHNAATVIERIEGNQIIGSQLQKRPKDSEIKSMALHFRVFTHMSGSHNILLGEVFIPSMLPFTSQGMGSKSFFQTFAIWKAQEQFPPGVRGMQRGGNSVAIGEMRMAISWTPNPNLEDKPEVGQLGIFLDSITFRKNRVEQPGDKNPKVTVVTYDQRGDEVMISRWDPRTTMMRVSNLGSQLFIGEAFGEHMEFPETKWRDAFGYLHNHGIGFAHHGWDEREQKWMWDPRIGKQYSVEDFQMRRELCRNNQQSRPNTISLKSCRIVAEGILQRSLHHLTNRQAALIADQAFSRAGAVPGIIEAVLVEDGPSINLTQFERISDLRAAASERGIGFVDVRHQLVLAHEESVSECPGSVNLFAHRGRSQGSSPIRMEDSKLSLAELQIDDPFPGKQKVLWIRFVRSGDGQRLNAQYKVDSRGDFPCPQLALDMEFDTAAGKVQMNLTKEEFVTCLLSSPILGEALRRMTTFDISMRDVPTWRQHLEKPLRLDIAIADPTKEEADADFMDAVTVQQSILFEVYDSDRGSLADFLGECYLPPFDQLSSYPTSFVLPLMGPSEGTRPAPHKDGDHPDSHYTGNLFIEASWNFPEEDIQDTAMLSTSTLEQRAKKEEKLHTGKLEIKIVKAEGLRNADITEGSSFIRHFQERTGIAKNDAYVAAYVKNEACVADDKDELPPGIGKGGWRVKMGGVAHEQLFQTKTISDSIPVWDETFQISLQTGAFEKRTKQKTHYDLTRRAQQQHETERLLAAVHENNELQLKFGKQPPAASQALAPQPSTRSSGLFSSSSSSSPPSDPRSREPLPGERHKVDVWLGDTIFQFKTKLAEACRQEASQEGREASSNTIATSGSASDARVIAARKRKTAFEAIARDMSYRYVVMVFVPSRELRDLYRAGRTTGQQYESLYNVEFADPSSWQPLDPLRTFQHYAGMYGFGSTEDDLQQLRVVEGSEDYKTRNNRYRHFVEEEQQWRKTVEQVNKATECFGYAKYVHKYDGDSTEWRPILAERVFSEAPSSPSGGEGRRKFRVTYIHAPVSTLGEMRVASPGEDAAKVVMDESSVLLAPMQPKLMGPTNLDHIEFLRKARQLEDEGSTEEQIVQKLNKELIAKWQRTQEAEAREQRPLSKVPTPISLREVQHALRNPDIGAP